MEDFPGTAADPLFDNFNTIFTLFVVVIIASIIVSFILWIRNVSKIRKAGYDPTTLEADLAVKLLDSKALGKEPTVEERLAKLASLRAAGTITDEEYSAARGKIITDI